MDKYLVVGNPIEHSRSPEIHTMFAEQCQQQLRYDKLKVDEADFESAVRDFARVGGKGMNVTVPFKEEAFAIADELSEAAQLAGAVNTLSFQQDGRILGDNTDGLGMVNDIVKRLAWPLQCKRILLLGAGGAVKGVLLPLLQQKPAQIVIANRTAEKAKDLARRFSNYGDVIGLGYAELENQAKFDVVINGTSAGLDGEMPPVPAELVDSETAVYDMLYAKEATPCLRWAQALGVEKKSDGLGMLVGQAAQSFKIWRHIEPDTSPVIEALQKKS